MTICVPRTSEPQPKQLVVYNGQIGRQQEKRTLIITLRFGGLISQRD